MSHFHRFLLYFYHIALNSYVGILGHGGGNTNSYSDNAPWEYTLNDEEYPNTIYIKSVEELAFAPSNAQCLLEH
jgi:hypothetical protein